MPVVPPPLIASFERRLADIERLTQELGVQPAHVVSDATGTSQAVIGNLEPETGIRAFGIAIRNPEGNWELVASGESIGPEGKEGKTGPAGPPGATFVFTQGAPLAEWTIKHELKLFPSVTVIDTAGDEVQGIVEYVSNNELKIVFSAAVTGTAYLN
jgi:hypothetical protein